MSRDRYAIILNKPIPDHTPPAIEENVKINEQDQKLDINLISDEDLKNMGFQRIKE